MQQPDEKIWLWNEVRYGNEKALYQLYMDSYDRLFRYGIGVTADRPEVMGCINEVFAEIWEKRDHLPDVDRVQGYLFIIFKRKLNRAVRWQQPAYSLSEEQFLTHPSGDSSYEELLIASQAAEEKKARIRRALDMLTPRQKELIRLRYFEELAAEEIADRLQISLRTIYNTIHSAIVILRRELTQGAGVK